MHKYLKSVIRCYSVVVRSPLTQHTDPVNNIHEQFWTGLKEYENKTAISCTQTGRSLNYGRLKLLSTNMAYWLQENCTNFNHHTTEVATVLPNSIELAISVLGALEADVPVALFNPEYTSIELSLALSVNRPKWIITTSDRIHTILEAMSFSNMNVQLVTVDDDITFNKVIHFEELVKKGRPINAHAFKHGGIVMYNDGEARKISQRNIFANCVQVSLPELCPIQPGDKIAAVIPMWNCHGLTHILLKGLKSGAEIVTMSRLQPAQILPAVHENSVTILPALSSMTDSLVDCKQQQLKGLKSITLSGRPSSNSDRLSAIFPGELLHSYGPAEGPILFQQRRGSKCRNGSVGQLLPGTEARVTSADGNNDLPHNVPGEIWVRGPQLGDGKLWTSTGDQGYYDEDGWFYITDQSEMNIDGLKISPTELETVLKEHEGVADAAVFPVDKQLIAAVVPLDPYKAPTCKELNVHLGSKLAPYKQISKVVVMSSLPKDTTGHVDRKQLSKNYNPLGGVAPINYI